MASGPVRVVVCDDSAVARSSTAKMIAADPANAVVATVANGEEVVAEVARRHGSSEPVEVVVLDIEMPVVDGLAALPRLLAIDPAIKVLMASNLTKRGAAIALEALRRGAADYMAKPSAAGSGDREDFQAALLAKVRGLARLRRGLDAPAPAIRTRGAGARPAVLAIGSSTGGPNALFALFGALGRVPVPVLLTQHMPPTFTPILAAHLDRIGPMRCAEVEEGELLEPGHIHLAPGDRHMVLRPGPPVRLGLTATAPVHFCRPSVDVMLDSVADQFGGRALVIMLTGMGQDGLTGTRRIVEAGGTALAQDEASSVVWGMPGVIARAGLCHAVLPIPSLAKRVQSLLQAVAA